MLKRIARFAALLVVGWLAFLASCQHRLIYLPRHYQSGRPEVFRKLGGVAVETRTSSGRQVSWLLKPKEGAPERLWLVCGGNGALALEMEDLASFGSPRDAYLFFEYPAYGQCEGNPSPRTIRESLRSTIPAAATICGIPAAELKDKGLVFGHSLGAAVGLMGAEEFGIREVVLVSPFTSTMDMARVMTHLPLGWLVWHRFDNRTGLRSLQQRGGHAWIIHGTDDEVIPVRMGRALAQEFPQTVTFREIPEGHHNDLFDLAPEAISEAMARASGTPSVPPAAAALPPANLRASQENLPEM